MAIAEIVASPYASTKVVLNTRAAVGGMASATFQLVDHAASALIIALMSAQSKVVST